MIKELMNLDFSLFYQTPRPRQQWINNKFVKSAEKNEEQWTELFIDCKLFIFDLL